ncbi:hypothetical protein GR11A_00156 [Vibrio phage vB_VcorM_GR11A]|nr:hypothetical protein GR11A_00156 [Vibrio phage vB_VcorM_GR11A]
MTSSTKKPSRSEVAAGLTKAGVGYLAKKGYACDTELSVVPWGDYRSDVYGFNMKGEIIILEIKSCHADFKTDHVKGKWKNYVPYCNKMYFLIRDIDMRWMKQYIPELKEYGVGLLLLHSGSGLPYVHINAKHKHVPAPRRIPNLIRLAWRNAPFSQRQGTRRQRVMFED